MKMQAKNGGLDQAFIERQRERLEALRDQLVGTENDTAADERALQDQSAAEANDTGDTASNLAQMEVDEGVYGADSRRLAAVERALEKLREGTYGISDRSGEPIPQARLEAVPEAIYTAEEEP
jgi:DnaK suppressor protein